MIPCIYDCEVFRYDWFVVVKQVGLDYHEVIEDPARVKVFFSDRDFVFAGFNTKHYDKYIIQAIADGWDTESIKDLNDWIIGGREGWEYPPIRDSHFRFQNVDLMDDMQKGLSLKAIEGHLGMSIEETEVDFDLDRPLTQEERDLVIKYCCHDVDATEQLWNLRKDYLDTKISIGNMCGLTEAESLAMTNAKLTARFLHAQPPLEPRTDERRYRIPDNLDLRYIPNEVMRFFNRMYDQNVSDEELFGSKLEIDVGGTPGVVGYGGIHAAVSNYRWR